MSKIYQNNLCLHWPFVAHIYVDLKWDYWLLYLSRTGWRKSSSDHPQWPRINYTLKKSFTFFLDFDSIWQTSKNNEFWRMLFVQAWNPKDYFRTIFLSDFVWKKNLGLFPKTKNSLIGLRIWFSCNWLHSLLVACSCRIRDDKSIDLATDHPKNLRKRSEAKILPTNLTTK